MTVPLLGEAALRSLLMGVIVLAALRLLRIRQVRSERIAWLLALLGAFTIPVLVGWHMGPGLLPDMPTSSLFKPATHPSVHVNVASTIWRTMPAYAVESLDTTGRDSRTTSRSSLGYDIRHERMDSALYYSKVIYFVVAASLLFRFCLGLTLALQLRNSSRRSQFPLDPPGDVRISPRIIAPVTVASSILLPESYTQWDAVTLRIVLTHERAHVRQGDFYVQLLSGLHCVIFWFSPFSWWLQRRLADLGEALSDHAAVGEAESRTSYAEVLLSFATAANEPLYGVAIARSNLRSRIDRLLSDEAFHQSFIGKQRIRLAACVVTLAVAASASVTRVRAVPMLRPAPSVASRPLPTPISPAPPAPPSPPAPPAVPAGVL